MNIFLFQRYFSGMASFTVTTRIGFAMARDGACKMHLYFFLLPKSMLLYIYYCYYYYYSSMEAKASLRNQEGQGAPRKHRSDIVMRYIFDFFESNKLISIYSRNEYCHYRISDILFYSNLIENYCG